MDSLEKIRFKCTAVLLLPGPFSSFVYQFILLSLLQDIEWDLYLLERSLSFSTLTRDGEGCSLRLQYYLQLVCPERTTILLFQCQVMTLDFASQIRESVIKICIK